MSTCTCPLGTLTTDSTLGQICVTPKTPAGTCPDSTWASYTSTTCQKAAICKTSNTSALPSTTISTTANYCGDQYNNKGCKCMPQVTPGVTPATQESANVDLVCAYQENGIQYACDPGCCPGGTCSSSTTGAAAEVEAEVDTASASSPDDPVMYYGLLTLGIILSLLLALGVAYMSSKKS